MTPTIAHILYFNREPSLDLVVVCPESHPCEIRLRVRRPRPSVAGESVVGVVDVGASSKLHGVVDDFGGEIEEDDPHLGALAGREEPKAVLVVAIVVGVVGGLELGESACRHDN